MSTQTDVHGPQPHRFRIGRAAFLGLTGVTGAALLLGNRLKIPSSILTGGTNVNGFTIYTIAGFPTFDPKTYRLRVDGLVEEPREYTYSDLLALPSVSEVRFYQCVTGWVVPKPRWQGTRLWDLVAASKPKSAGRALRFTCMDGAYSESLTFPQAQQHDVLLAYGLNGKALSREQGMPIRLVVPGMYGYKFAKWVNHIEVVDRVIPGFWENNGYDVNAYIGRSNGL
ncbi:MAG TPA: molybdopterin-dependent oxidoreductase [Chloroflexota bacterium]|nr:molybdopterin-dependent oxidoreductase [Chloroflexota bacterium]